MKKISPLLLALLAAISCLTQTGSCLSQTTSNPAQTGSDKEPSFTAIRSYHGARGVRSVYNYHLDKIRKLLANAPAKKQEWEPARISNEAYSNLSLHEKFTYNIDNEESFTQICSITSFTGEELFAWLLMEEMGSNFSERQRTYFKENRDSVIRWMKEGIAADGGKIGLNYKRLIVDLNAKEMIPFIISHYKGDHDVLTVLMLLMKAGNYAPFIKLELYKDLYERPQSMRSSYVPFTPPSEQLILKEAKNFSGEDLVKIPKGEYQVGKQNFPLNPLRKVQLDSFRIAVHETTNRQFASFISETGYITDAEKRHDALVFAPGLEEFRWLEDSTACWRYPNGISRGGIEDKMDHPVTCISYTDILAYCKWAGARLPTLDEWEVACRAGTKTDFFFGNNDNLIRRYANIWHGRDHLQADSSDGYMYTSPVGSFAPNPWGLYDMYGNVFEFCSGKIDPKESNSLAHARGGSWWCSAHACHFFTSYDIGRVNIHASFSNQGFRIAR
ncbi:MAG TPA: SUMF1/EgtB/PvdO family nonheme iron enzyme [Puia sp.]